MFVNNVGGAEVGNVSHPLLHPRYFLRLIVHCDTNVSVEISDCSVNLGQSCLMSKVPGSVAVYGAGLVVNVKGAAALGFRA